MADRQRLSGGRRRVLWPVGGGQSTGNKQSKSIPLLLGGQVWSEKSQPAKPRAVVFVSPPSLDTKVGQTYLMLCFIPSFLCQAPSLTFLPWLPPAALGVLPSARLHRNLPSLRSSRLYSSNLMSPCILLVIAPLAISAHVMSLI